MNNERMLSIGEIAIKLGRSERYVSELAKLPHSPFVAGRAFFSEIINFLKNENPRPCARKKRKK